MKTAFRKSLELRTRRRGQDGLRRPDGSGAAAGAAGRAHRQPAATTPRATVSSTARAGAHAAAAPARQPRADLHHQGGVGLLAHLRPAERLRGLPVDGAAAARSRRHRRRLLLRERHAGAPQHPRDARDRRADAGPLRRRAVVDAHRHGGAALSRPALLALLRSASGTATSLRDFSPVALFLLAGVAADARGRRVRRLGLVRVLGARASCRRPGA